MSCGQVQFVGEAAHFVIREGYGLGVECIGLDDVGARFEVFFMNIDDDPGLSEAEQVIIAPEINVPVFESFAPVIFFSQFMLLDHGTHSPVDHHNALLQQLGNCLHVFSFKIGAGSTETKFGQSRGIVY